MTSVPRVLCFGEVLVDLIGEPAGPASETRGFRPRIGGAPANVAVALTRLSVRSAFVGAVADDPFGPGLLERLNAEGVDVALAPLIPGPQTRLAVVTGPADRRIFTFYGHPPADSLITADHLSPDAVAESAAVYLGSLPLTLEPSRSAALALVDAAHALGVPVCFDPNPRSRMIAGNPCREAILRVARKATLLKLSVHDLDLLGLTPSEAEELARGARVYVVSNGRQGCDYRTADGWGRQPAFIVEARDETGAGDAFTAALITRAVAREFTLAPEDFAFAAAVGALTTTRLGAMDALPRLEEVHTFLAALASVD